MTTNKTALHFCKLPLIMAIGAIIGVGCSTTAPMRGAASPTHATTSATKVTTIPATPNKAGTANRAPVYSGEPVPAASNSNSAAGAGQSAVATNEAVSQVPATDSGYSNALLDDESLEELANLLEATDMTMVEDDKLAIQQYGDLWDRMRAGFSINQAQYQYNPRIEAQKSWFTSRQDYINRLTARASRYLYHTVKEAERRNIPTELALLPVIESSYDPTASSNASAAGMWQFIPSTGRIYGLTQTPTYDGRRDVVESTRAAYDFLTSLYNQFGSWELALAAYNAGPGRIQRAIDDNRAQGLPTDFWSLDLPQETMNYVPRFMAVAQIVSDADRYGIYLPAIANRQHFRSVPVKYGVSLQEVAQITGQDYEELRMLNPALIAAQVDMAGPNRIIIPNSVDNRIDAQLSQLTGNGGASTPYMANIPDSEYAAMVQSSEGLAEFATKAQAPLQNETFIMPVATAGSEPAISADEKQFINSQFASFNTLPTTSATLTAHDTIVQEPPLSPEEKSFIAAQIQSQSPDAVQVVSPIDGNVKLEAVQTQQSILQAKGQEKRLSFERLPPPTVPMSTVPPTTINSANPANTTYTPPSIPKGKRSVYTVQRGDTLSNIAIRAGLNWRDIADWNQINPNGTLLAGTRLYLYNAKPMTQAAAAQSAPASSSDASTSSQQAQATQANSYIVRSGDTLIGTANKVGLSVSQLARYNGLSTQARLQSGQKLWLIPGMTKTTASTANSAVSSQAVSAAAADATAKYAGKTQAYTVQRGESLIGLAARFNVPLTKFAQMNDLSSSDELLIGQRLTIPATSNDKVASSKRIDSTAVSEYTVKAGDTLIGIANQLKVSHTTIAALNNFASTTKLQKGQVIKLPVDDEQIALALSHEPVAYKVQGGDTLIGVASRYKVAVADLAAANNLSTTSQLIKGKTLTIPSGSVSSSGGAQTSSTAVSAVAKPSAPATESQAPATARPSHYKVKSGDSLIGLAKKYGMSVSALAQANNLKSDAQLQIGQDLSVPATTTTYKVVGGDSLIRLAKQYGMTPEQFADLNGIASNTMLQTGQTLKVPVQ